MEEVQITSWADGDSGEMVDKNGRKRRFRLSGVYAPDRLEFGYGASTIRAKQLIQEGDTVSVNIVSRDSYGRDVIEMNKSGRGINEILERVNKIFSNKK